MNLNNNKGWRVGDLARLTGHTIRTLHYYDEIGLLVPSSRTEAGHRLYSEEDVYKLQQITSLKQLGFSLQDIILMFENPKYNPQEVLTLHLRHLDEEIKNKQELRTYLSELQAVLAEQRQPTFEQFIRATQLILNQEKYFTRAQRSKLRELYEKSRTEKQQDIEIQWNNLLRELKHELEQGTPSSNTRVQNLAAKWRALLNVGNAMGSDSALLKSAEQFYADHPQLAEGTGMTGELYHYITEALAYLADE